MELDVEAEGSRPGATEPWVAAFAWAPVPLALLRPDGTLLTLNARARTLLGRQAGERLQEAFEREDDRAALARALVSPDGPAAEPPGGEWHVGARRVRVRLERAGATGWWVAALEDVTAERQREADLLNALEATSSSLERVTDGFVALDRDWRYTYVNATGARLLGRTPEQLVGRHIWTEFPTGVGQPFHLTYERAMREQQPQTLLDYYVPFGRWFENRIYPSPDGLSIYFHDVTETVRAREHLEGLNARLGQERQWLEELLERLPVALALVQEGTGQVTFANRLAVRTLGGLLAAGSASAGWWSDVEGQRLPVEQAPQARVARGEVLEGLALTWHAPSGPRSLLVTSASIPGRQGQEGTGVLVLQDVTELQRARDALARSVQDRDEFMSVASHELKTPLAALALQVERLVRRARSGGEAEALGGAAEPLRRSVSRLDTLVQALLDVSRIASGRLATERVPVDLSSLVREVLGRLAEPFARAGCAVQADVAPFVVGRWDRVLLEQVVTNLLTNASKYGAGRPVHVRLEADAAEARLTVRDEGIGIAPEEQGRIFERFERAVSVRHYGGFGLGLWIVRQAVEAQGGTVQVESLPGRGATFRVALPR
jgi:PAS domain S-box-containing protein